MSEKNTSEPVLRFVGDLKVFLFFRSLGDNKSHKCTFVNGEHKNSIHGRKARKGESSRAIVTLHSARNTDIEMITLSIKTLSQA